ncbi:NAD(P)-binding protein [Mycena vitilis]|nr:NAD(P)-binding protein [Mycena vitilis]
MTITQDSSAPLVAVVGATGIQGGSVVSALAESDKAYRVRGFTRDASKPAAQNLAKLGVEVVALNHVVENKEEVYQAFAGADFAFLMTSFWEYVDENREISEGKLLIDAAKAAGVSRIVWSGLPSISKASGGKYVHVYHFDAKAAVTEYGYQCGVPFVDVQAGFYGTNFLTMPLMLKKQEDGSFTVPFPSKPTTLAPFIDAAADYGLFVRHALELPVFPAGSRIVAYGEKISFSDMAQQLGKATGKKIVFEEISAEQHKQNVAAMGLPQKIELIMTESFLSSAEFEWWEPAPPHEGLPRRARTWAEFAQATDWSKALA